MCCAPTFTAAFQKLPTDAGFHFRDKTTATHTGAVMVITSMRFRPPMASQFDMGGFLAFARSNLLNSGDLFLWSE